MDTSEETAAKLGEAYQLFIALLSKETWGGACLPPDFSDAMAQAVPASINPAYERDRAFFYDDPKCVTGTLRSERLRDVTDLLLDYVVGELENDPSWCFTTGHGALHLRRCDEARLYHQNFSLLYGKEYCDMHERFPSALARALDAADPGRAASFGWADSDEDQ